ncbi:hypothetical protein SAMN02745938_102142 [Flavobacterium psychrophilum DSM 3660]|nr:hypothetical protein SAMN02745938_102142 [Flavobacterium psychrophilum DSM 3660] [Flavobacterium psychrophilum DSM 3660 = ATCC 49418]
MIETPADYRSFVFCKANKTPVSSSFALGYRSFVCFALGYRSFVFCKAIKTPVSSSFTLGYRSFVFCKANIFFGRDPKRVRLSVTSPRTSFVRLWAFHFYPSRNLSNHKTFLLPYELYKNICALYS